MSKISRRKTYQIGLLVTTLALISSSILPALAAPGGNQNNPWGLTTRKESFNTRALKEVPDLEQLPTYSGKSKFVAGRVQTNEQGWVVYTITTIVKEDPSQVTQWYQNAFTMYKWNVLQTNDFNVTGDQKNGNLCSVAVNPATEDDYHATIEIVYSIPPQGTMPSTSQ